MALSGNTVWEVRSSGDDTNGGAFVAGATGTDYSQQDAAQVSYTDLVIDGSNAAKITSSANPFGSNHVGNIINITSGTGFTTGRYEITAVAANVATLDRNCGTTSSTGGNAKLGGAVASPGIAAGAATTNNKIWCKGTFTISSNTQNIANGNVQISLVVLAGYSSSRGDHGKAIFNATHSGSNPVVNGNGSNGIIQNIRVQSTTATGHGFSITSGVTALNCEADGFDNSGSTRGFNMNSSAQCINCYATGCGNGFNGPAAYCTADSCAVGFDIQSGIFVSHSIAKGCTTGFNTSNPCVISHCVAYNCTDGFLRGTSGTSIRFINCLAVGNSDKGFESGSDGLPTESTFLLGCAGYNNTGGDTDGSFLVNVLFTTLTADPFVNTGTGDFRLNETTGGGLEIIDGAYPQAFPGLAATANHATVGAAGPENFGARAAGGLMYPTGRKKLLDADIDLLADDIKAAFLLDSYTFDSSDEFLSDITGIATNGTTANLSSKSTTGGVFDAADSTCTPDTSQDVNAIVLYKDTGSSATSPLIAYIDNFTPFTTSGSAVPIIWSDGAEKIFAITDLV